MSICLSVLICSASLFFDVIILVSYRYRGYKMLDENVALPSHGAAVLVGEVKTALLDGDSKNYDMERGFSRDVHSIAI